MESIDRRTVNETLSQSLGADACALEARVLLSEYARLSIFGASGGRTPIHTSRVLDGLSFIAEELLPSPRVASNSPKDSTASVWNREGCRDLLDDLAAVGDLQDLGRGYWLPSPLRFIPLNHSEKAVLIGGVPLIALPPTLKAGVSLSGVSRIVPLKTVKAMSAGAIETQTLESWLGHESDLLEWTKGVLAEPLHAFVGEQDDYQIYRPSLPQFKAEPQYFRWADDEQGVPDGRCLIRVKAKGKPRNYGLAEFRGHKLAAFRELPREIEIRRLQYGLDALAQNPVVVRTERTQRGPRLLFSSPLSRSVQRLLVAVGTLEPPPIGKRFPIIWTVPTDLFPSVRTELARLHLKVG